MKWILVLLQLITALTSHAQAKPASVQVEADYYASAYAGHYGVPMPLVRAIIGQESNWQPCAVSSKGAMGLMQLMPKTARRLGVRDACNINQNLAGGIRYLAQLMEQFHNDLRLVTASYYAGEDVIAQRGLAYRSPDVLAYVCRVRKLYLREAGAESRVNQQFEGGVP